MKSDPFQRVVGKVISELPPALSAALSTVQVVVREVPSKDELKRAGLKPGDSLYGLFDGVALPDKPGDGSQALPDRVILYRRPLEEDFPNPKRLEKEIRVTLIHELGHFFGMDEGQIEKRGFA